MIRDLNTPERELRKGVPGRLRTAVFQEALATCPLCGLQKLGSLQLHHIDGDHSHNALENLMAVCGSCHDQITKGIVSEADVRTTKRMLQCGVHRFAKSSLPPANALNFSGTNTGIVANKVTVQGRVKGGNIILPGTVGSDPEKYNYVEYLIKRLTKFREAGVSYGQKRKGQIHTGSTRSILGDQLGGLPKDQPVEHFEKVVAHIKGKIDKTILGKTRKSQGKRNYHEFNEHGLSSDDAE
jgi:hypothetical protein